MTYSSGYRWQGTPIQDAITSRDRLIVSLLKQSGGRVSASFESDALFDAAATGNVKHLALLTDAGTNTLKGNYDKVLLLSTHLLRLASTLSVGMHTS